ncbi:hypothetical protein AYL99_03241 [Fonsecaea erecta]|uniref:Uncharacterized protein n=1 Tax=Fonsecaea erecta TaxID=1367422 RepID=A0A178ZW38_9EURO|nr:hypothetical protein AYL99_03241 [Fonsecaea erecta]OAP64014.1 hypothetical protein AYL99_03241 [Fonsecaea erecta]
MASQADESMDGGRGRQHYSDQPDLERKGAQPEVASITKTLKRLFRQILAQCRRDYGSGEITATASLNGASRLSEKDTSLDKRARQCCFLCVRNRDKVFAIIVPCLRPTSLLRQAVKNRLEDAGLMAIESDAAVFERLHLACFKYYGAWKRYLPYYGVTKVEEIQFRVAGRVGRDRAFPIVASLLDIGRIQEVLNDMILEKRDNDDYDPCLLCSAGFGHSHSVFCRRAMKSRGDSLCIMDLSPLAHRYNKKLRMLDLLTKCGRRPWEANGLQLVDGMAGGNLIYQLK